MAGQRRARARVQLLTCSPLSPSAPPVPDDPKVQRELAFFERVKQRLRNREAYTDFLKCLNMFGEDIIGKLELVRCVRARLCTLLPLSSAQGTGGSCGRGGVRACLGRAVPALNACRALPSPLPPALRAVWCTTSSASTRT